MLPPLSCRAGGGFRLLRKGTPGVPSATGGSPARPGIRVVIQEHCEAGSAVYGVRVLPTSLAFVYTYALLASNNSEAGSTRNHVLEGLRASLCGLSALSGI